MSALPPCPECKSESTVVAAVPGLATCQSCGRPFPLPDDVIELLYEDTEAPEEDGLEIEPGIEIPDLIECAIGWRAWGVKANPKPGATPLMYSATYRDAFWTPGQPMVATCEYSTGRANGVIRKGHECPDENCHCGLYSAKSYEHLMTMPYHQYNAENNGMFSVVGRVKVWGKVIEGTQGWRASYGYPESLYVPFEAWELIEPLQEAYGVEVELKNVLGMQYDKKTKRKKGAA